jgi:hypothetical protein
MNAEKPDQLGPTETQRERETRAQLLRLLRLVAADVAAHLLERHGDFTGSRQRHGGRCQELQ